MNYAASDISFSIFPLKVQLSCFSRSLEAPKRNLQKGLLQFAHELCGKKIQLCGCESSKPRRRGKRIYLAAPASLAGKGHDTSQPELYPGITDLTSEIELPLRWKSPQAKQLAIVQKVLHRSKRGKAGDCDYHL